MEVKQRTIFLKSIKDHTQVQRILKSCSTNKKLGNGRTHITKGAWKGLPMYQLTLEERKTCPTTCQQWNNCYGNNMPFAHRLKHTTTGFLTSLQKEVKELLIKHPQGIVIRLHVLGDFFSTPYVMFWKKLIESNPTLKLFGYTHRLPSSSIGKAITKLNKAGAWIRWSDQGAGFSANVNGEGITCPQQTGKTASCATCALCWSYKGPINFMEH